LKGELPSTLLCILGVARLSAAWIIKQKAWIFNNLFFIVSLGIILWAWGGARGVGYLIVGMLSTMGFSMGVNMVGQEVGYSRVLKSLDLFLASPITPRVYIAGVTLGQLLFVAIAELPILIPLGLALGYLDLTVYSLLTGLALIPFGVLLGTSIAFYIKKPGNISAITNPIVSILTLLPPVFYPTTILPEPLRYIALLIPTSAAASLARTLGGLETAYHPLAPLMVLAAWTIAALIAANRLVKWSLD